MKILLTNDDGMSAEGVNSLYESLVKRHNVYLIAPNEVKSGCSNALTFRKDIKIENISEKKYIVHGYTADCINIGIKGDLIPKVNLVISGINHGPNLGDDIHFSGTVAGARVAFMYGISGIAISLDCNESPVHFYDASEFLLDYIDQLETLYKNDRYFLNINYPDIPKNEILGVKYSFLGKRVYRDSYKVIHKSDNEMRLQLDGRIAALEDEGSDVTELKKGHISITPMTLDCTDYEFLNNNIKNHV